MNLYILRHASAGTSRQNPALDARRPLDKEGKQHCLNLAHTLNALKISFDLIVSSPLKRAMQTAQLLATETGYEAQIAQTAALAPTATPAEFYRLLDELARPKDGPRLARENVLCVGHNPNLTGFLASLLTGRYDMSSAGELAHASAPQPRVHEALEPSGEQDPEPLGAEARYGSSAVARVRLRKGSLARVALTRGNNGVRWSGTLLSLIDPRTVRALYRTSTVRSRRSTSRK